MARSSMVSNFQALLLEGVFYRDRGALMLDSVQGDQVPVIETLVQLGERQVQISIHHLPPMPPDPTKWGGGCCLWQTEDLRFQNPGRKQCPFGHHEHPTKLLNVVAQGQLALRAGNYDSESTFAVRKFDGTEVILPLHQGLVGHHGRIAAATVLDIEKMREALLDSGAMSSVEGLGGRLGDLKDLLQQLQSHTKRNS